MVVQPESDIMPMKIAAANGMLNLFPSLNFSESLKTSGRRLIDLSRFKAAPTAVVSAVLENSIFSFPPHLGRRQYF